MKSIAFAVHAFALTLEPRHLGLGEYRSRYQILSSSSLDGCLVSLSSLV